jgi:hypothetical protein
MKFIEDHWWIIVAIVFLWAIANYGPKTTTIAPAVDSAGNPISPSGVWYTPEQSLQSLENHPWYVAGPAPVPV